jgi:hypothetical protein
MNTNKSHDVSQNTFHFDRTLNIGNIVGIIILILTLTKYSTDVIHYLKSVDNKVSIMWLEFSKTHPEAKAQLDVLEGKQ